jgi:uncharacterized protein YqgC (DUF456 family)
MDWLQYPVAALFALLGIVCIALVIIQMPGTWIMLALAVLIEFLDRYYLTTPDQQTFGWVVLGICLGLALIGEALEFAASVLGAKHGGASRAGMIGSLIGGVVGALMLAAPFSVVPVIGTIGGALMGAVAGTFIGAVIGEIGVAQRKVKESARPAFGASVGRVVGTMSKMGIAMALWIVLSVAAFWP